MSMLGGGWIEAVDPRSGKTYYANTVTKQTQWEKPVELVESAGSMQNQFSRSDSADEELPSNWEVMHDPTTGKPFYVDHERKITQWTRPEPARRDHIGFDHSPAKTAFSSSSYQPTHNTSHNITKSYFQEASYFQPAFGETVVDFSDGLPKLEFSVKKVADKFRSQCPNCEAIFTLSKRRHHCRLCGDVFCDSCSSNRVSLPLEGPEFEKPVRVCDPCNKDIQGGNFFSMRRYLAPLTLCDHEDSNDDMEDDESVASIRNVNAALDAFTTDLDQFIQSAEGLENKVTIPPDILVPNLIKHLKHGSTAERAVRALSSLLSLGSMTGKQQYGRAILANVEKNPVGEILNILEKSGSDRRTLFVQEKAAQLLFHLTDTELLKNWNSESGDMLDIKRCLRNVLDHSSSTKNPNLQRWSIATIRNLIIEDERRTCLAINDMAAQIATGLPTTPTLPQSCLDELVSTGGIMILCSLIAADDSDTRTHAISALDAILTATQSIDNATSALSDMSGGTVGHVTNHDAVVIRAIMAGGGVGASVSQLLLSADNNVAQMGCNFVNSLVIRLLRDKEAFGQLPKHYNCQSDSSIYGSCREAALGISTDGCLPALMSLIHANGRPSELRSLAAQSLAAVVVSVVEMGKSWSTGSFDRIASHAPSSLLHALNVFLNENVTMALLDVSRSPICQSLSSNKDSPGSRIQESVGAAMGALASFFPQVAQQLSDGEIITFLLSTVDDPAMSTSSSLVSDQSPKYMGCLEAAVASLLRLWQVEMNNHRKLLDTLLLLLDSGIQTKLYKMLATRVDWESKTKAAGSIRVHTLACTFLGCLFGFAHCGETEIGMKRLVGACGEQYATRKSGRSSQNLYELLLGSLQSSLLQAHKCLIEGLDRESHFSNALVQLVNEAVFAAGSACGSASMPWKLSSQVSAQDSRIFSETEMSHDIISSWQAVCRVACDILVRGTRAGNVLVTTLMVGAFGEEAAKGSLRLSLVIAERGEKEQRTKLAQSGVLAPVADLLKSSLDAGNLSDFTSALAIVRLCGPYVNVSARGGGIQPVKDAIRTATKILWLPSSESRDIQEIQHQESLKQGCIAAIEALSTNAALWNSISSDSLASIFRYLDSNIHTGGTVAARKTKSSALSAILRIIQVPSSASYAIEIGLLPLLSRMLRDSSFGTQDSDDDSALVVLRLLHHLTSTDQNPGKRNVVDEDMLSAVFGLLGTAATTESSDDQNLSSELVFLGLEIAHRRLADIEALGSTPFVLQSEAPLRFLNALLGADSFVKSLCMTCFLFASKEMPQQDPPAVHGRPLSLAERPCAGFSSMAEASFRLFFHCAVYASAIEDENATKFWNIVMGRSSDEEFIESLSFATVLAKMITDRHPALVPTHKRNSEEHENLRHPLVLYKLLEAIKEQLETVVSFQETKGEGPQENSFSAVVENALPKVLLVAATDPALSDLSQHIIRLIVEAELTSIQAQFLANQETTELILSLLRTQLDSNHVSASEAGHLATFARLLIGLVKNGAMAGKGQRESLHADILKAIASACAIDWTNPAILPGASESYAILANDLTVCLIDFSCDQTKRDKGEVWRISQEDAVIIADALGKKICKAILTRFLERARLQECNMGEELDVLDIPEVDLLCALAEHRDAMALLRSTGGYHALSQIAGEGKAEAISTILRFVDSDLNLIVDANTHVGLLSMFLHEDSLLQKDPSLESKVFSLLAALLGQQSMKSKNIASIAGFQECLNRALKIAIEEDNDDVEEIEAMHEGETKEPETKSSEGPVQDRSLLLSCQKFLSSTIVEKETREVLLNNAKFVETVLKSAGSPDCSEKQLVGLRTLVQLVPFVTSDSIMEQHEVAQVFRTVLGSSRRLADPSQMVLCAEAARGLSFQFQILGDTEKEHALRSAILAFERVLKCRSLSQCTQETEMRASAAELGVSLTSLFVFCTGDEKLMLLLQENALNLLASIVQWHFNPELRMNDDEAVLWKTATSQSLQVLSCLLCAPSLPKIGVRQRLQANVWMVAAPQRSPQRALEITRALELACQSEQAVSALMAKTILSKLKAYSIE